MSSELSLDNPILTTKEFIDYIASFHDKFFKWIRLRKTGPKTTLTIKEIFNTEDEYPIDKLKEIEIGVNDFNTTDKFLQELDFVCDSHQEKRRIHYHTDTLEIDMDFWPLINPYVEIEGTNEKDKFDFVEKLGYSKSDAVVTNTDSVYRLQNINREDYYILSFDNQ